MLVGAGVADESAPVLELMESAVRAAAADAGAPSLLRSVQWIAVTKGSWSSPADPGRLLARRVGAGSDVHRVLVQLGVPQQTPVSAALRAIRDGALDVAVVVGGEARAYERAHGPADVDDDGGAPDEVWAPQGEIVAPGELAVRLVDAVHQYAVIENGRRAAEGRSIDDHLDDIATLWAGFNAVARRNPHAAFASPPRDAAFLRAAGPDNRLLAWPYAKWHSTQWTVDQAGALLLCSAGAAAAHGVPRDRWLFPLVALESSFALSLSRRRELHRWPAMRVLGEHAAAHIRRPLREIEHIDLYSCFPVAVRVQQRELGLPFDGVPTVTGGMAFAGGPFNNYTYQSTAAIAARLRDDPAGVGLVSTVSGFLTKPGLAVWSPTPPADAAAPLIADLADHARAATAVAPVHDTDPGGRVRVAGYTVLPDPDGTPARLVVVGDAVDDGRRVVRVVDDGALATEATRAEQVERVLLSG